MNNLINMYAQELEYLNDTITNLSRSGDSDFVAAYEEKVKYMETLLIQELAKEADQVEDATLIMYRTTNYGIVTPQIARRIFNNKEIL